MLINKMKNLLEAMRSLKENTILKETGEWDDSDDGMASWKEDMKNQASYLANKIDGGKLKSVHGFDKYQGPFAVVSTPKYGDVVVWFNQEDDTGSSFNVKVAHVGWLSGDLNYLSKILNQDKIPESEVIGEKKNTVNEEVNNTEEEDREKEIMKKCKLWDGRQETYALAKKHFDEIKELAKEFK